MKVGVLFSGGKDSTYAAWLVKQKNHQLSCLITLKSENNDSFMFHTPAIDLTKRQAESMGLPLITYNTKGEKEEELKDLETAIEKAVIQFKIEGIVTGAIESVYQSSRIQKICDKLKIKCLNPLWKKNQISLLKELVKSKFEIIISAVAAYPLDKKWVGRKINESFIEEVEELQKKYKINPAGEGGEFESLVLDCPLFKEKIAVKIDRIVGENNTWRAIFDGRSKNS